ncbi:HAMP domain-containing sensor histidine kinase [Exiguobacterium sp. BG5(2022)]|uniref:HAMP domain-containing sensor histidine kinase n=1 Tax=Exiguobacterium sp. BG5(2022) TaxID=2962595 RepID=UPI002882CC27|nr:HAMP domain-containing sensor histidine kinase [Exiguobacterium sp. BG5(2022)]MDT0192534.1 HAMP domain-containing sensor histidine kinase [Exiguobacterium sp. BG5(2022)]
MKRGRNSLPFRISLVFLLSTLLIEGVLFLLLYHTLLGERVVEEINRLESRAESHASVLAMNFSEETIDHVATMESETDTKVAITDPMHHLLQTSRFFPQVLADTVDSKKQTGSFDDTTVLENDWENEPYLIVRTPITDDTDRRYGYVYMFLPTEIIHGISHRLQWRFLYITAIALVTTVLTFILLSRLISKPIQSLKQATENVLTNPDDLQLPTNRVDEIGELARAIESMSVELSRLRRERRQFLSDLSHEIKTPLTYLRGYAEIASKESTPESLRKQSIQTILDESRSLTELVENAFQLAQLDENTFLLHREEVTVTTFCADLRRMLDTMFRMTTIRFDASSNAGQQDIALTLDRHRMLQVFRSIAHNAIEHSEASHVSLRSNVTDTHLILTITDNGKGIPEEDLPHIFDRLYRVEKSRSRQTGGSGLGLAIADQIVNRHGGELTVTSDVSGTSFTVTIPLDKKTPIL